MNVREFWLTNSVGDKWSLNQEKTFANNPSGLGYGVDISVAKLGDTNVITSESYNLPSYQSELVLLENRENAYKTYGEFVRFLSKRPILFHYRPPHTNESYRCACRVTQLAKTEYSVKGYMSCPINIYRQSMWYGDTENVTDATKTQDQGKQYPLSRPYRYGTLSTQNIRLYNDGMADAPTVIEIVGACTDPLFNLYDANGNKYGACKISGTYDYVSINSDDIDEGITLERSGSSIPNAVNYQDLTVGDPQNTYVTFVKLKPGNSTLVFTLDNAFSGYVRIRWRNAYVTV